MINSEAWVIQTRNGETLGCACFESSYMISRILDSAPILLELDFSMNVSREYERAWGKKSLTVNKDEHAEHFKCATKIASSIDKLSTHFVSRVEDLIKIREDSYISNLVGGKKRDVERTDESTRQKRSRDALMESFGTTDRGSKEEKVRDLIEKVNEITPFVLDQRWLANRIRREISGQTMVQTNGTGDDLDGTRGRVKRTDPITFINTIISVSALASSIGSSIYLSNRLERLIDYIDQLSQAVEMQTANQKSIYDDAVVLRDSQGLLALGLQQMGGVLTQLIDENACIMDQTEILFELRDIANRFSQIESDLMSGIVTTRLITMAMLKQIFKHSSFARLTYLSSIPTIFYRESAVSVLKTDIKRKVITLLLISPRVEKEPRYQLITLHGIDTSFKIGKKIYNKRLIFEQNNYAIPIEIYNKHRTDMNLTLREINEMRIPIDCFINNGIYQCHNFISIDRNSVLCFYALIRHSYSDILFRCQFKMTEVNSYKDVSHSQGATGILISIRGQLKIYGQDNNRNTMFKKDELTKMKGKEPACVWIPSIFSVLTIEKNGKVIEEIRTENHLYLRNPVVGSILNFNKRHFNFFKENISSINGTVFNFTGITSDVQAHWKTIKEIVLKKFNMNKNFSILDIAIITVMALLGGFCIFKVSKCILDYKRKQRRQNSYGESSDLGQNVAYDARSQRLLNWRPRRVKQKEEEIAPEEERICGGPASYPPCFRLQ